MHTSLPAWMASLGVAPEVLEGGDLPTLSPIDGQVLAQVRGAPVADVATATERAHAAFLRWRSVPAPQRGAAAG